MELLEQREQITIILGKILSEKPFLETAKQYLFQTFLLMFDHYAPPPYIKTTRTEYLKEYLTVLHELKMYQIIDLEDLNDDNRVMKEFRKSIERSKTQSGNLEKVNGHYVPSLNGRYYCTVKGFANLQQKAFFTLNEGNFYEILFTCYHEMTHLGEGENAFPISAHIPISFELQVLFEEGHAATRESYLDVDMPSQYISYVRDDTTEIEIESMFSYPLYGTLYKILQLIFGVETLENLSKNDDKNLDMFEYLKEQFPSIPVADVFAHLTYILMCSNQKYGNKEVLKKSLLYYRKYKKQQLEQIEHQIKKSKKATTYRAHEFCEKEAKITRLEALLSDEEKLKKSFLYYYQSFQLKLEKELKKGKLSIRQYQDALLDFKKTATLSNYLEIQRQKLRKLKQELLELQELLQEQLELISQRQSLEESQYDMVLQEVCFNNPSLKTSFEFLEKIADLSIEREYGTLSESEKIEQAKIYHTKRNQLELIMQQIIFKLINKKNRGK